MDTAQIMGHMPHLWYIGILPFIAILGSIAVLPLLLNATRHWWEHNLNRFFVAMLCSLGTILYMIFHFRGRVDWTDARSFDHEGFHTLHCFTF